MPKPAGATRLRQPVLSLLAAVLLSAGASAADWRYDGVGRIVAISDVHGAYASMVQTLGNAGILGDQGSWAGGSAHLVVTGDLVDRGADSRKVMDLLMQLEREAAEAGGRVHVLLGNHEVMNLTGDLRYVAAAEYEAFAADEAAGDRARAFDAFVAARPDADRQAVEREFGLRAPPGYFGHRRAFAPDGRYGEWLLEKPLIVVINDTAFVHGGLSPMVAELGLDGVNRELKEQVSRYAEQLQVVLQAGLLDPTENFYRHGELLAALPPDTGRAPELAGAISDVVSLSAGSVHDTASPLWYRGNVGCSALIENDKLDAALAALGAKRVAIGHTPTITRKVLERLDGRVIEIDTGMLTAAYGGTGKARVIEGESLSVVDQEGTASLQPVPHPRPAAREAGSLTAAELEQILAEAEVLSRAKNEDGRTIVRLRNGSNDLPAVFAKNPRRGFVPELAAYRLDRLLELDMVPVTVAREIDGEQGTLQVFTANAKNELERSGSGEGAGAWCALPEQWNAMYVFDALVYNALRHPQSILYNPGNWQLMLADHDRSFAAKSGKPDWLQKVDLSIGSAWVEALSSLTDDVLQQRFSDVLDQRRLSSLGKRRDELLAEAAATATR